MSKTITGLPAAVRTPLVAFEGGWVKVEGLQLTGSVKYRMVSHKITQALASGDLREGQTLVEASSGSTALALAWCGKQLGYPVEIYTFESIPAKKLEALKALGAVVHLSPPSVGMGPLFGAIQEKVAGGSHWHLGQFDRASVTASYAELGREIVAQLRDRDAEIPERFLCPVGTGGLIQGVGAVLRELSPGIEIVSLEPEPGQSIDGLRNTEQMHMGDADPYDLSFPDRRFAVPAPGPAIDSFPHQLGESARAILELRRKQSWTSFLTIAADGLSAA